MNDLFLLKIPFKALDIEWRVQSAGTTNGKVWAKVLAYVTNRAIMDRLDSVVGPDNWKNEYLPGPQGGIMCGLSIKINGEWITKWDGAENTNVEAIKGGFSGAMKRAAVQWGIGRYLYNLPVTYASIDSTGKHWQPGKQGKYESFNWTEPMLPELSLPPTGEKKEFLKNPGLSVEDKDYILTHPLTDDLKAHIEAKLGGGDNR